MDFHSLISCGLDKTLRCFVCKNYLSYFPISLCSNNQSLCGRCAVPEGLIAFQEEAFETICQFFKFPCRYQSDGCLEELAPKDVPEHEKNCPFRTVQCLISKPVQCHWKGSRPSLLPHCRSEHSDLVLKNGDFQMDLSVSYECDNLLENNDVLFNFSRRFDSTSAILSCALYNHELVFNTESDSAQLSVKNGTRTALLDLKATGFPEMIFTELSLVWLRSGDKQNSSLCHINIGNAQNEEYQLERVRTSATVLSVLKCSTCSELALPPIYLCAENMDTICSRCRQKHRRSCTICSKSTTFQKSLAPLDTIAILADYPCKYQKNGCTSTLKYRQMKRHHKVCAYGNNKCPFSEWDTCEWKGLKRDVKDHVLKSHQELLVHSSDELELAEDDETPNYNLIQFSNHLFRLIYYVGDDEDFMWSVQTIGSFAIKFKYEIDIVDGSNSGRRMLIRECCDEVTDDIDKIDYSRFRRDQICNFLVTKDKVTAIKFRVNIFR